MWPISGQEDLNGNPLKPTDEHINAVWKVVITENTYYVRCTRSFSCCDFGESNIVSFKVDVVATCPIDVADELQVIVDCDE